MVGNSLRIPSVEAGQEDISKFVNQILAHQNIPLMQRPDPENDEAMQSIYNSLGRPEEVSGYQAPEGTDPESFGALAPIAHQLGLSRAQYEGIVKANAERNNAIIEQAEAQRQEGLNQLRGEWGLAFEEKHNRAGQVLKALGGHEALEAALANGQVDAPTLRLLDTIAQQLGAEGSQIATQLDQQHAATPEELIQRRDEITARLLKEDLSQQQRDDLQRKVIQLSEQIVSSRRMAAPAA